MSYVLNLYFRQSVMWRRMLDYFGTREHFKISGNDVFYQHSETGTNFSIKLHCSRNLLLQKTVVAAEFEINYHRPSYFGIEAEKELSAFVGAFRPRINDDQIRGMGDGYYSGEGFLSGWNFGNVFSIRADLQTRPDREMASLPANTLNSIWAWNYHRAGRSDIRVQPKIMLFRINGRLSRMIFWARGAPVLLPEVDYILVGREVSGERHVGMATWSEVLEVARRAGFDTANVPLCLDYFTTPQPIAEWVANIQPIQTRNLERIELFQVLDDELIAAAREMLGKTL